MLLTEFLSRINGSERVRKFIEKRVVDRIGMEFKEISIQHLLSQMPDINYFNIHDENDKEVSISHQSILQDQFPNILTKTTTGLGHMRILKNAEVISTVVSHIMKQKTNNKTPEPVA